MAEVEYQSGTLTIDVGLYFDFAVVFYSIIEHISLSACKAKLV